MDKKNSGYGEVAYVSVHYSLALGTVKILITKYLVFPSLLSCDMLRHHVTLYSYLISESPYGTCT